MTKCTQNEYYAELALNFTIQFTFTSFRGSRISRWEGRQSAGGGGADLRRGHFSVKMYAKMKELGSFGGRVPAAPPGSARINQLNLSYWKNS